MKKILISTFFICFLIIFIAPVFAEQPATRPAEFKNKETERLSTKAAELENLRIKNTERVRVSVRARWEAYNKLLKLTTTLLDKIQIRIDHAKASGQDTKAMEVIMADAKANLADAKTKMEEIKSLKETAMDKKTFLDVQKRLQAVHKDLNAIRLDVAKITRTLKSFNSLKPSTSSAKPNSTTSAERE